MDCETTIPLVSAAANKKLFFSLTSGVTEKVAGQAAGHQCNVSY
jgi:hypothetical protein